MSTNGHDITPEQVTQNYEDPRQSRLFDISEYLIKDIETPSDNIIEFNPITRKFTIQADKSFQAAINF